MLKLSSIGRAARSAGTLAEVVSHTLHDTLVTDNGDAHRASEDGPTPGHRWLLLIYRVPQDPPGRRTYVWRRLKQLGALYLQQAVGLLPDQPDLQQALESLAGRIAEYGGETSLLRTESPNLAWQQHVIERFNQARGEEYAELSENVERFEDEIRREQRKGRFTYAQLEDIEADWDKLQRWSKRIAARDFFNSAARAEVDSALERGHDLLEAFRAAIYEHEATDPADS
jgi:hypothetical protein